MEGSESFRLAPEAVILAIFVHKDHVPSLICNMCKKKWGLFWSYSYRRAISLGFPQIICNMCNNKKVRIILSLLEQKDHFP
jgi:hypothetical protein